MSIVCGNFYPGAQSAQELMSVRINHNSYMTAPHNDVSGKRNTNTAESVHAIIEVSRSGVVVREPGALINVMDQV
jgi:hypothetical protein